MVTEVKATAEQLGGVERIERGGVRINKHTYQVHYQRRNKSCHHSAYAHLAAQQHKHNYLQRNFKDIAYRTNLELREEVMDYNTESIHTARHQVVGVDKEYKTCSQQRTAEQDIQPVFDVGEIR